MPMLIATSFVKVKKVEATQCPSMHELVKQNEVYPFSGLLFSLKKEGNPVTYSNISEPCGHYAK